MVESFPPRTHSPFDRFNESCLAPIAAAHDGTALLSSFTSKMSGVTTDSMALFSASEFTAIRVAYDRT